MTMTYSWKTPVFPLKKLITASLLVSTMAITGCDFNDEDTEILVVPTPTAAQEVTFASFNVSFAVDGDTTENFERWVSFMELSKARQDELVTYWHSQQGNDAAKDEADYKLAERVIQIRNIAAIIQKNRPDVLLLNEFNNDGEAKSMAAIVGFQKNYLSHPQSMNSVDGGDLLEPIEYPFTANYPTNTGLVPNLPDSDLANDGINTSSASDAYGFGFYHGHYAFALFSRFPIDTASTRTFQTYKWKDLPGAQNPTILAGTAADDIPTDMQVGDYWYSEAEWNDMRLSSKNHVDAPVLIPTTDGYVKIHALLSHPTPPISDKAAKHNTMRNGAENQFWARYLDGHELTDDKGKLSAFAGTHFMVMGDLNADALRSPADTNGFTQLTEHPLINQDVSQVGREFTPVSAGGTEENNDKGHPYPETRTSTFGSRADYVLPSASLTVTGTGVYWVEEGAPGRLLFNDSRIGTRGADKEISSDHRYVWTTVKLNTK